jgi:hypothetical protein
VSCQDIGGQKKNSPMCAGQHTVDFEACKSVSFMESAIASNECTAVSVAEILRDHSKRVSLSLSTLDVSSFPNIRRTNERYVQALV